MYRYRGARGGQTTCLVAGAKERQREEGFIVHTDERARCHGEPSAQSRGWVHNNSRCTHIGGTTPFFI